MAKTTDNNQHIPHATNRRTLLKSGGGVILGALAAPAFLRSAYSQNAQIEGEVVFACDGGNTQNAFEQKIFPDFAKKYGGVKLTYVPGQAADSIAKLRVQKNQPSIDVAWMGGGIIYQAIDE